MIFPKYIQPGDTIGVTALSRPIENEIDQKRFNHGKEMLKKAGYETVFTDNVFNTPDRFGRSAPAKVKAEQFNGLVADKNISAIFSASGGDFLAEMLPFVDLEAFKENPKWVQGYSDNTSMLYYLTTKADVATAYGANFGDFGMDPWECSVEKGLSVLDGSLKLQESFEYYQDGFMGERVTGFEGYADNGRVEWKTLDGKAAKMNGRLIGGCMDVLLNIAGTPFDGTNEFIEKYKDDGIIWFLESFDLGFEQMMEGLWKMKAMGWFEHVSGFVFGRPHFYRTEGFD